MVENEKHPLLEKFVDKTSYAHSKREYGVDVFELIVAAGKETQRSGHAEIGTAHILLAIRKVRSDSMVAKNLPRGIVKELRAAIGKATDGRGQNLELSAGAKQLLERAVNSYGGHWDDYTTYRIETRKLVFELIARAPRQNDEQENPAHGVDCAMAVLRKVLPDLSFLIACADYDNRRDLREALRFLPYKLQYEFLAQVLDSYHDPQDAVSNLVNILEGAEHNQQSWDGTNNGRARIIAEFTQELQGLQSQLQAENEKHQQVTTLLSSLTDTAAGYQYLVQQKDDSAGKVAQLNDRIAQLQSGVERNKAEMTKHEEYKAETLAHCSRLREVLKLYHGEIAKAKVIGKQQLIAGLVKLAKE